MTYRELIAQCQKMTDSQMDSTIFVANERLNTAPEEVRAIKMVNVHPQLLANVPVLIIEEKEYPYTELRSEQIDSLDLS